jgi:hypothetical protein
VLTAEDICFRNAFMSYMFRVGEAPCASLLFILRIMILSMVHCHISSCWPSYLPETSLSLVLTHAVERAPAWIVVNFKIRNVAIAVPFYCIL